MRPFSRHFYHVGCDLNVAWCSKKITGASHNSYFVAVIAAQQRPSRQQREI